MTAAQRETIAYFESMAREDGSRIDFEMDDNGGIVWVTEVKSIEWDGEITQWFVGKDGVAQIL